MKKYIIYIGILAVGLLLGWFLFGGSPKNKTSNKSDTVPETIQMWTCAMHPHIMLSQSGDCPVCGMDLIPTDSGTTGLLADQFKLTENAMALANIQTSIVGEENLGDHAMILSGKIVANEEANAVQVSYFSGRIERLHISFTGEEVRKGQLLATIYSPELYAAQQELITASSLKESQPELYKAVRNKLKIWKLSEKQINLIEETGKVEENMPVYASISGTVSEKLVEQGDYIKQGQPLLKITNLKTVWANFDIYEKQVGLFKKGQEILVSTNASKNNKFKAKVDFIDPVLDARTRTMKLRVVLNNTNGIFKPGMFVEGSIKNVSINKNQTLSIPATAILWTGKRSVVYVKTNPNEPIFEMRQVVLGNKTGDNYTVEEGLNHGDEIVTNGTFTVDAAAQLQGKKSMMNKEGGKTRTGHEGHIGMEDNTPDATNKNERIKVPIDFQNQLKVVFNNYIKLKDALVKDDSKNANEDAKVLLNKLSQVNMKLLNDPSAHKEWMQIESDLRSSAQSITVSIDIEEQRMHFQQLSVYLTNAIHIFGINEKVYSLFCPMVDNNKGAYWLSKQTQVINPYYGKEMLECGEVSEIIE